MRVPREFGRSGCTPRVRRPSAPRQRHRPARLAGRSYKERAGRPGARGRPRGLRGGRPVPLKKLRAVRFCFAGPRRGKKKVWREGHERGGEELHEPIGRTRMNEADACESSTMWVGKRIVPVSRGYGDVQPRATLRGPETRSVQPALLPGRGDSPLFDWPRKGRKPPHPPALARHTLRHRLRSRRRPRIIGPRLFCLSCVLAFLKGCLKDWGPAFSLTARVSQPMGESQTPRAARPLLFSPVRGETQGPVWFATSGNRVSPSQGAVRTISGYGFSPS